MCSLICERAPEVTFVCACHLDQRHKTDTKRQNRKSRTTRGWNSQKWLTPDDTAPHRVISTCSYKRGSLWAHLDFLERHLGRRLLRCNLFRNRRGWRHAVGRLLLLRHRRCHHGGGGRQGWQGRLRSALRHTQGALRRKPRRRGAVLEPLFLVGPAATAATFRRGRGQGGGRRRMLGSGGRGGAVGRQW